MGVFAPRLFFLGFVGLTVAIIYNALYLQPTRVPGLNAPPLADAGHAPKHPTQTSDLVLALQRELAERGYEPGANDGVLSAKTALAIGAYQRDNHLPETGKATDALLKHIVLGEPGFDDRPAAPGKAAPTKAPVSASGQSASDLKTATVRTVEIKTVKVRPTRIPVAAPEPTPAQKPIPAQKPPPAAQKAPPAKASQPAGIKEVQQVLADLGYTPGPIDGTSGSETRKAVSAFEKDRGLKPSGEISPKLLGELKRITGRTIAVGG